MTEAVSKSSELLERRKKAVANGVGVFNNATVKTAKGEIIYDQDERELIDFSCGIGVVNAGHCPDPVVKAIQEQAEKFIHTSFNVVTYEGYIELCEKLAELIPHGQDTKAMLVSTGAEAVENAVKIARQATQRQAVLCYTGAFHGRTMMAMTLTSKVDYKLNCGPFAPEVYRLPFPNFYRYGGSLTEDQYVDQELKRLWESGKNVVNPKNLAAIIMEPIQGEGGFNIVPERYLKGLREFCDEHGIVLILDEVQSGFGRAGAWVSYQNMGIEPDITTVAKAMGSGMPIAGVVGKASIMDSAKPGTIGGTYIGNPLSCAASLATIKMMEEEDLNSRARIVGDKILLSFGKLKEKYSEIGDVRGMGAMIAMEFVKNGNPQDPDSETCAQLVNKCFERGLVLLSAGTHKNIIRVLCPLTISEANLQKGLSIIEEEMQKILG